MKKRGGHSHLWRMNQSKSFPGLKYSTKANDAFISIFWTPPLLRIPKIACGYSHEEESLSNACRWPCTRTIPPNFSARSRNKYDCWRTYLSSVNPFPKKINRTHCHCQAFSLFFIRTKCAALNIGFRSWWTISMTNKYERFSTVTDADRQRAEESQPLASLRTNPSPK